ncbi:UvrD-helicase domain-containing protein [Streptomyces sp. LaBMicrA B280]|uniref:UvrD-helicase domain-containing protein n=1 Tax=Streptomyces sp. LaBMicrA B280 TaxID=3391001 RepID=UPI003BA484CF
MDVQRTALNTHDDNLLIVAGAGSGKTEVISQRIAGLTPTPRRGTPDVVMSLSDLKYLFECPYSFKLRLLHGFDSPLQKELGFGKSLHDVMAEIHKRAIEGGIANPEEAEDLVNRHLNLPFANKAAADQLRPAAERLSGGTWSTMAPPCTRRGTLRAARRAPPCPRRHRDRPCRLDQAVGHQRDVCRRLQVQRTRPSRGPDP